MRLIHILLLHGSGQSATAALQLPTIKHQTYMKNISQRSIVLGLLLLGAGLFQVKAGQPIAPQGIITAKVYTNIPGGTLADLTGDAKFASDSPDLVKWLPYFELWATGTNSITPPADSGDNHQ